MPYRIAKSLTVESGHLLSKHPGSCRFPHGHSRTVEVVLTADTLDARDMVCDFKALKHALETTAARLDHRFAINADDPNLPALRAAYGDHILALPGEDPTSEVLARLLFHELRAALAAAAAAPDPIHPVPPGVRLERVRITETATSWAEYWE